MPHKYEQLYNQVKEHNGGLIKFINILNKNNYDYELRGCLMGLGSLFGVVLLQ